MNNHRDIYEQGAHQMTDLPDKTIEELVELMAAWMDRNLLPLDTMATPFDILDELARRLLESKQHVEELQEKLRSKTCACSTVMRVLRCFPIDKE